MGYAKVQIVLKNAGNHHDYNKRILEYLNDRHTAINDNKYTVAIEVADETNIDDFVIQGMESLPSLQIDPNDPFIYGVNSIIAMLAKLEIVEGKDSFISKKEESSDDINAYYSMALEEMKNKDEDDNESPSTIKAYRADVPEAPMTDKMIEEKSKAYNKIYEDRRKRNEKPGAKYNPSGGKDSFNPKNAKEVDIDKLIRDSDYDEDEAMLMRRIAAQL